jgi:hypothetical protein
VEIDGEAHIVHFKQFCKGMKKIRAWFLILTFVATLSVRSYAQFWGEGITTCPGVHTAADGNCYQYEVHTQYVFWVAVDCWTEAKEVPCD